MPVPLPKRELGKSKFSMYLRTKCDRELYLSLFSKNDAALTAAGIPVPLKSRPGVQLITASGREFEYDQFDELINAIPANVIHKSNGRAPLDLSAALKTATDQSFLLQPEIEPEDFRATAFKNLGVAASDVAHIPRLSGLRPDALFVGAPGSAEYEVLPSGNRKRVDPSDKRRPISVIDLKNITEANASYSAEVCLYAFFLSNWIATQADDTDQKFFVADTVYLWRHVEMPRFKAIMATTKGGDHKNRVAALLEDLKDGLVSYLVFMPSVRKFFVRDVPRVVKQGDDHGWASVEYHVNPRCSSCDWLGNKSWLTPEDKAAFDAHPDHYCYQNAEASDHLSKLPSLSKGAARVLTDDGITQVASVAAVTPANLSLKKHAVLKRDRNQIADRAKALVNNTVSLDTISKVGGLSRSWNVEYDVVVNFDSGAGLLTGVAVRGVITAPFGQSLADAGQPAKSIERLGEAAFVVPKDNLVAEWATLQSFIDKLAEWVEQADATYAKKEWGAVHSQVCFWEPRQYEELCNAFGRHLFKILDLPGKTQRALAWLFPAEKLMERDEEIAPGIVYIRDIVTAAVLSPQRFSVTLLGTAEHYHHPSLTPRTIDNYYREPLGNAIPRERIFGIWKSPTGTVRLFGKDVPINEAIDAYGKVLVAHAYALGSITARLRSDLKGALTGNAPALKSSIPGGINGVAHDSKLWSQWDSVSAATAETNARLDLITRPEWLEASYKAIVLEKVLKNHGGQRYTFLTSEDSTEAKIQEGDAYCILGRVAEPGFPLLTPKKLGIADDTVFGYYAPLHGIIATKIVAFNRATREVEVQLRARYPRVQPMFDALMAADVLKIGKQPLYVMESMPPDQSGITTELLKLVGNPGIAAASPEALEAMGRPAAKKLTKGTDVTSPAAQVLWQADKLATTAVRSAADANALALFAKTANAHELNPSQLTAVKNVATNQLSIVWGPPGTGKTDTLTAFIHAVVREGKQRKILITGPNYRTVEELAERLTTNLIGDAKSTCSFFWVYSRSREPKQTPPAPSHLTLKSLKLEDGSADVANMEHDFADANRTVIVATTAHILDQVIQRLGTAGSKMDSIFDLVVLDESSQVPVTLALRPICGLKGGGQLVIAGDHLQMPPIHSLEPPAGAEHLVNSVQTYLLKRFKVPRQELLVNYRSNSDLVEYAKTLGYPAKLTAFAPKRDLKIIAPIDGAIASLPGDLPKTDAYNLLLDPSKRVVTLIHDDPTSSQANEVEAGLVAGIAFCLRQSMARELDEGGSGAVTALDDDFFFEEALGIVTPHKAQKALVVRALIKLFPSADPQKVYDSVDTVERFQGGERQTIIVSFGVGDTDIIEGEEAFLLQMERTNVAVSRAKAKCIVLMPESLAYHLPRDQKAAEASIAIKSYIEEFCANRTPVTIEYDGKKRSGEIRWR